MNVFPYIWLQNRQVLQLYNMIIVHKMSKIFLFNKLYAYIIVFFNGFEKYFNDLSRYSVMNKDVIYFKSTKY